jgi:hypothetical protein
MIAVYIEELNCDTYRYHWDLSELKIVVGKTCRTHVKLIFVKIVVRNTSKEEEEKEGE